MDKFRFMLTFQLQTRGRHGTVTHLTTDLLRALSLLKFNRHFSVAVVLCNLQA